MARTLGILKITKKRKNKLKSADRPASQSGFEAAQSSVHNGTVRFHGQAIREPN
jgi:hypothetical protein